MDIELEVRPAPRDNSVGSSTKFDGTNNGKCRLDRIPEVLNTLLIRIEAPSRIDAPHCFLTR